MTVGQAVNVHPSPLRLLTTADLPEVDLRAATLDGDLYAVGDAWAEIATVDDPRIRASSVTVLFERHVVAARDTAAWIWMASGTAPWQHHGIVPPDARHRDRTSRVAISEMVIADDEVVDLAGIRVTTPCRTALDIARSSTWTPGDERRVRHLIRTHAISAPQLRRLIDRHARLPNRVRAWARLRSVVDPLGP